MSAVLRRLVLPEKASALIENAWQSVPELVVSITENSRALRGVIPVEDIGDAMRELQSNSPKPNLASIRVRGCQFDEDLPPPRKGYWTW